MAYDVPASPYSQSGHLQVLVLPLPSVSTARKYMTLIQVDCGFDKRFFAAFQKKMATKDSYQHHGILVFNEIQVRQKMTVHSKTKTCSGFTDFGESLPRKEQLADHGLVFMFRSFGDAHSQPIAIFASKGPTKGTDFARLVMKAVILLERAGAIVDALVGDGAAINRRMWKEYSVSGNFENLINYYPSS